LEGPHGGGEGALEKRKEWLGFNHIGSRQDPSPGRSALKQHKKRGEETARTDGSDNAKGRRELGGDIVSGWALKDEDSLEIREAQSLIGNSLWGGDLS